MATNKIVTPAKLLRILARLRKTKQIIITTNGVFDILHPGHLTVIEKAKKMGGVLFVLINSDKSVRRIKGPKRPVNTQQDRAKIIAALAAVDYVCIFSEDSPVKILGKIKPAVHVKARDYQMNQIKEKDIVEKNGGRIVLLPVKKGYSTSALIAKILSNFK